MKKRILFTITSVLLITAYVALGIFAYAQDTEEVPAEALPINGVWRVVSYNASDKVTLIPCEFMVFTDDVVADYRDNLEEPFVEAAYTYEDNTLAIASLGRNYVVDRKSEHVMYLYKTPTERMELAWYGALENFSFEFSHEDLQGSWNTAYRCGLEQIGEEALSFDTSTLSDYRNGSQEPAISAAYEWDENGNLVVSRLAKIYILYPISLDEIYFVETDTGYIWNLTRVE